jgi:hypothetical protein
MLFRIMLVGGFSQIERGEACSMSATPIATEFCVAEKFRYVPTA